LRDYHEQVRFGVRLLARDAQRAVRSLRRRHRAAPWDDGTNSVANAQRRVWACFEFMDKLGVDYYCFHDRDVAPEARTLAESNAAFDAVADELEKAAQKQTGKKLLWGTACLFAHPATARAPPPVRTPTSSPTPPLR
jgi:xylose isomerase